MTTSLLRPAQWARKEFALVELGDRRLTQRLVRIGTGLAQNPGGTLPRVFGKMKELKAAYRFFGQAKVGPREVQAAHRRQTLERCRGAGEYLLIEDSSELDYSDQGGCEDLGSIGNGRGRGLLLHTTLAVAVSGWGPTQRPQGRLIGLLDQQCWRRLGPPKRGRESWKERIQRPRESLRWAAVLEEVAAPPAESRWVFIADREADFYEPIQRCQSRGVDFVIRAYRNRRVVGESICLQQALERMEVKGTLGVELRARAGRPARTARVEVRSGRLSFKGPERPDGERPDLTLNVVEVREVGPPVGIEPLHWILLTSLSCAQWVDLQRIIGRYTGRWWIEEYHKALKSGVGAEESQMHQAYRIETLVAVLAIVAVRLLNAKLLARARSQEPADPELFGPQALELLTAQYGKPLEGWTHANALVAVARLGGFLARKNDGMPGWQTIWRGWHRLMWMCEGLELLQQRGKRCG